MGGTALEIDIEVRGGGTRRMRNVDDDDDVVLDDDADNDRHDSQMITQEILC